MFATLLESRRTVTWPLGNGALSLITHTGVVAVAVVLTASPDATSTTTGESTAAVMEAVVFVPASPPAAGDRPAVPASRRSRRLVAPTVVALTIPDAPMISEADFAALVDEIASYELEAVDFASRVSNGDDFADGEISALARTFPAVTRRAEGGAYYAADVERMAVPLGNNPRPRYPFSLLGGGIEGDVIAQFVIDSTGRADARSLTIMRSTHELFTRAVKSVLPRMRFLPAEVGGIKVRVLVQQPFRFSVR